MFDGGRMSSAGIRYIDDINAAKETQTGNSLILFRVGFETARKMPQSNVLDLI